MKEFNIILSTINRPRDICERMRGVKHYTYTIRTISGEIIKEGKANDDEWMTGTWGNRIYRQAGGIKGWGNLELNDSNANKTKELMAIYFPNTTKDEVIFDVHDFTDDFVGLDRVEIDRKLLNDEHDRIKAYEDIHGSPPKMNIQVTKTRTRAYLNPNIFEFVDSKYDRLFAEEVE